MCEVTRWILMKASITLLTGQMILRIMVKMKYLVRQITDRFQNEIVNGGFEDSISIDNGTLEIGEKFWSDNVLDTSKNGMYEVIGVTNDLAC